VKESKLVIFQTSSLAQDDEFAQYGYLLLRGFCESTQGAIVISASNPQTLNGPAEYGNEHLAIEAIAKIHPNLVMIDRDPWRQWASA
jgi:hypothetical protein